MQSVLMSDGGILLQVISMAHSKVTLDGQALEEGKEHLGIIVKDNHQKGFCIKIISTEVTTNGCTLDVLTDLISPSAV